MNEGKGMAMREKLWTERDHDEKLAALRDHVLWLSHLLTEANERIHGLMRHEHCKSGLLTPLSYSEHGLNTGPRGRNPIPTALRDKE